jgi:cytochrome b
VRSASKVAVWGPFIRIGHWLLVAAIAIAWFTRTGARTWHEWTGYVALALAVARTVWGFVGTGHARFASFVRGASDTWSYAVATVRRREPRYMGHNPLGGYMIVALLLLTGATGATGWLYTTDRYWGVEWVERLHSTLADLLLIFVALHVAGVIAASLRHRENLIAAMLHGRKRGADDN